MENLLNAVALFTVLMGLSLNIIWKVLKVNTTFSKNIVSDKILLYIMSEISYDKKFYENFFKLLNNKSEENIKIPIILVIKSIFTKIRIVFIKNWLLFAGVFSVFLWLSIFIMRIPNIDIVIYFLVAIYLFIVFSYFSSMTVSVSIYEANIYYLNHNISDLNLIKTDEDRKRLIDEVKVDFDLYKNNGSLGLLILPFFIWVIINYIKIEDTIGSDFITPFLILIFIWSIMSLLYKSYRSDVIYITYQALNRYKVIETNQGENIKSK